MADAIGSVRATFTASAGGMIGAIDQIVGKLGGFAAAQRKVAADTTRYGSVTQELAAEFLRGGGSLDEFATKLGNVQGRFRGVSEAERTRVVLEALQEAFKDSGRGADELAAAQDRAIAVVRAGSSPIERLSVDLRANRKAMLDGKISVEEYRDAIARLPREINGAETAATKMDRIFRQSQETIRSLRSPTADLEDQLARLDEQFEAGLIDDQQYAAATAVVQAKLEAMSPEAVAAAAAAEQLAQAMERGKSITQQFLSPQEQFDANMAEMDALLKQGAISQETFERATAAAREKLTQEEQALRDATPEAKELAAAMQEGKAVTQAMLSPTDRYEQEIAKLDGLLKKGAISEETHARATRKAKEELDKAGPAAKSVGDAFGGLPGPLGAAARGFDMMQKSLGSTIAGFKSGGISGGISSFVGQLRGGISNAFSSGGASLIGIAPQIAVIAGAGYAAVQGIKALANALGEVGARVERTGQLAERLGVSFQQYEILATAANMAGVETEALAAAQTKGLKAIAAARDGAGAEAAAFEQLGISQGMLRSTDANAVLEEAAKRLSAIQDPANRAALAIKIFGKSGNDVLPALKGIDSVRDGIARLGGVMNQADQMRFTALDDAFDNAARATTRLGEVLLVPFTGLFQTIAEGIAATFGGISAVLAPLSPIVDEILTPVGLVVQAVGEGIGLIGRFIGATVSGVGELISGIAEILSYSEMLGPVFSGVQAIASAIYGSFVAIGKQLSGWIKWFEKLTGVQIMPMTAGSDAESIEEQIKARAEAEKAEEQRAKKAQDRAAQIRDSLLSPYQQMQQKVEELAALEKEGLLTAEERAAAEAKIRDEFAAQDPLAQQMKKNAEDQRKAAEDITKEIEKSATAGKDLGAAADPVRAAFALTAAEIRRQVEEGIISPEDAKKQMGEAVDGINEELKRIGEDQKFAEKIREGLKTEIQKVQEELDAIDANQTLTAEEKDKAKNQVRDKFASGLPGAAEKDAADKFREDQAKLKAALDAGLIDKDQFKQRQDKLREDLEGSVSDFKETQERNKTADKRAVGAVDVNSSEGASTFFRLLRGQDDPTKKQLDEMRKQTRLLERVAEAEAEVVQI